jgi:predicted transcriptional regulator
VSTTVHLPPDLLERVDRRARELGVSRNLYIRRALEKAVETESSWNPAFLKMLREAAHDEESREAVHEMMTAIRSRRRSRKKPPRL